MEIIKTGERCFCSWSGGKDSCLALHRAVDLGGVPEYLFTMLHEDGTHSRSHSIPLDVLQAQADCMNIPLVTGSATWNEYEEVFIDALHKFQRKGITAGVFGDIDLQGHLEWEEKVCGAANIKPCLPLWKCERLDILDELFHLGYKAMIVTINTKLMDAKYLGRVITPNLVDEFERAGIDPCGENGEYHTIVFDGPLFRRPLELKKGKSVQHTERYVSMQLSTDNR
ncbi:MAG: diphthine--ammonia ligase [Candidatus Sabulitectum sp.]|nr:diphthine--ammonia ligase [Candidatus Sabulitectum sp.]